MKISRLRWAAVIGGLALSGVAIGFFVAGPHKASKKTPPHEHTVSALTSTITIDPQIGETFAPPPSGAAPALTAEQAWAEYAQLNGDSSTTIPSSDTVTLGQLTLPIGPTGPNNSEAYTAYNELAYGYSWYSCPVSIGFQTTPPSSPCIEWNFLDAMTGQQIDETYQQG